jgi:hypothetical protein
MRVASVMMLKKPNTLSIGDLTLLCLASLLACNAFDWFGNSHDIHEMICMKCMVENPSQSSPQPVGPTCRICSTTQSRYYCGICTSPLPFLYHPLFDAFMIRCHGNITVMIMIGKFFDDEAGRDIFHCPDCGICRRGKRSDFFHCPKCNCCVPGRDRAKHKCVLSNVLQNDW